MHPRRMDLRVSFLLGSAQLTEQAQEEARVFAKALLLPALSSKRFRIEGHTDSSGTRALNLDLSRRRAQAVAEYLAGLGVQSDRLQVRGYGPDRPLPGHSPKSPENRRVEAQLL
jgi:OOP family OmpA-OmpF porin